MTRTDIFDCIIVDMYMQTGDESGKRVLLFKKSSLREVAFNDEAYSCALCYRQDENGYMDRAEDTLYESDFEKLYYKADESDKTEDIKLFETLYEDEPQPFVKADWNNHEHYLMYESAHGINVTAYHFDESVELIEGVCYKASNGEHQDYPSTEAQNFYKFVANDGRIFYVRKTFPFFADEHDYVYELISREVFEEYDDGTIMN